jgi:hypothetical protein
MITALISLLTYGILLNSTIGNHGDHCIIAYCDDLYQQGNWTTLPSSSDEPGKDECSELKNQLEQKIRTLASKWIPDDFA